MHGVLLLQVQDFALPRVERHVSLSPFLQPVEVPLDGSITFWCVSHSLRFGVAFKFAEDLFFPIIQIINEDVKQD